MKILILVLAAVSVIEAAKLQVPFQDFATPKPELSKKIYYLQDYCEICEKFRPDFTRIKKPADDVNATSSTETGADIAGEAKPETESSTLKRVPRSAAAAAATAVDSKDSVDALKDKPEKPEIILLDYFQDSNLDSDKDTNGTWSWKMAFKKIKAKWIEKFQNNTARKVENKMTAKMKSEKSGDEETKKLIVEFKKKIQNLTLLNVGQDEEEADKTLYQVDDEPKSNDKKNDKDEKKAEKERVLVKRELKQIFLDPIEQPSIVIRTKRSTGMENETDSATTINLGDMEVIATTTVSSIDEDGTVEQDKQNKTGKYEKCRLLIRFKTPTPPEEQNVTLVDEETSSLNGTLPADEDKETKLEKNDKSVEPLKNDEASKEESKPEHEKHDDKEKNKEKDEEKHEDKSDHKEDSKHEPEKKSEESNAPKSDSKSEPEKEEKHVDSLKQAKDDKEDKKPEPEKPEESVQKDLKPESEKREESIDSSMEPGPVVLTPVLTSPKPESEKEILKPESKPEAEKTEKSEESFKTAEAVSPKEKESKDKETESKKEEETVKSTAASTTTEKPKTVPKNTDFGLMVNIRKFVGSVLDTVANDFNRTMEKRVEMNPFWKNIKIFTSDPSMTEYWVEGKKVAGGDDAAKSAATDPSRIKRSISMTPSSMKLNTEPFIDMIDMDDIVQLLTRNETDLNILNEKWILLERKIFFDDPDADNDEELIINLFFKPKEPEPVEESIHSLNVKSQPQCPVGTFDCNSNGMFCIPDSLICNGEDNCGNAQDEMNCGDTPAFNVYYVYNSDKQRSDESSSYFMFDANMQGMFWLGTRILFILFATSLFLYILLLLCRMCDRLRSDPSPMFILPKGNYISISGDTIERKPWSAKNGYRTLHGSQMDTHGSKIREYIYVNNNYGQPQGSTVVTTDVQPPSYKRSKHHRRAPPPQQHDSPDISENDEYPPLYEESVRHYGTKR